MDTDWGDYLSEKKQVPTIPIMTNKEKFRKITPFSERFPNMWDPVIISW